MLLWAIPVFLVFLDRVEGDVATRSFWSGLYLVYRARYFEICMFKLPKQLSQTNCRFLATVAYSVGMLNKGFEPRI